MNQNASLPTRHSLIKRLTNWDDQQSWQDFFNTYWQFIYGVAIKAGLSDAEAQDVVQETVITVAKKIKDFQVDPKRGSFKAWLMHTTRWRVSDQFRKRPRAAHSVETRATNTSRTSTVDRLPDPASFELDQMWEKEWAENLLDVTLEKIKRQVHGQTFQIFHLYAIKQWPVKKVASATGATAAQIYLAKYKVCRLIKKEIGRLNKELL